MRRIIAPQHVAHMAVAMQPELTDRAMGIESRLNLFQQISAECLVGPLQIAVKEAAFEQKLTTFAA